MDDGDSVPFNDVMNQQGTAVTLDTTTGVFTLSQIGNYYVNWWLAAQGAGAASTVQFALNVNGVEHSTVWVPNVYSNISGTDLITVTTVPTTVSLVNISGDQAFFTTDAVNAGMSVIYTGN